MACIYSEIVFSHKNKWSSDTCYNVDEHWKHYAKWKKEAKPQRINITWFPQWFSIHICLFFLIFFSSMIYHRILNTVPCAVLGPRCLLCIYNTLHLHIPGSQSVPVPPPPQVSSLYVSLFLFHRTHEFICVMFEIPHISDTIWHLSLCVLLHSVWQSLGPSTLLQIALVHSFLWPSSILLYIHTTSLSSNLSMTIKIVFMSWLLWTVLLWT